MERSRSRHRTARYGAKGSGCLHGRSIGRHRYTIPLLVILALVVAETAAAQTYT